MVTDDEGRTRLNRNCFDAMAFDTRTYFGSAADGDSGDDKDPLNGAGLVEATLSKSLRGPIWAFVIANACPGLTEADPSCKQSDRRILMRAMTIKPREELPSKRAGEPPKSEAEMRLYISEGFDWREADFKTCPHAISTLLTLEEVKWRPFHIGNWNLVTGSGEPVVIADPSSVFVRAGVMNRFAASDLIEAGGPGEWAVKMLAVAEPCLKPTAAPAPWRPRP